MILSSVNSSAAVLFTVATRIEFCVIMLLTVTTKIEFCITRLAINETCFYSHHKISSQSCYLVLLNWKVGLVINSGLIIMNLESSTLFTVRLNLKCKHSKF